jgi:putative DNA primase/helicase
MPNAKIGILCGKISGIAVVDIDNPIEFQKLGIVMPQTPMVKTKKGWHYYYRINGEQKKFVLQNKTTRYGEVQADGVYVIAPPSTHHDDTGIIDGGYTWSIGLDDIDMEVFNPDIFTPIIGNTKKTKVLDIAKGVEEGSRNNGLMSFIGSLLLMYPQNQWDSKVLPTIIAWNTGVKPPLEDKVIKTAYHNTCVKEAEKRKSIKEMFKQQKTKKQAMYDLAKMIIEENYIKTIDEEKAEIYIYENGCYIPGESRIENMVIRILEECVTKADIAEILNKIKIQTYIERKEFDNNKNKINLKNGVYDILTKELSKHSPDNLFLNMLPIEYNPDCECPNIIKFLNEILNQEQVYIMQEWFGFCLYRQYVIKKAMIFVGEKNTGKTTLIRLLGRFLGQDNISGISLQALAADKFAIGQLYGKYANIYDDLSFKDIGDNGKFKITTGGGYSTGEYKFGNQFNFENYAKLVFACNKIPNIKDTSDDAYFDRWIITRFDNTIEKKDPLLIDKLNKPEELSGLFNWALEGLYRLLSCYEFSYNKSSTEIKAEMMTSGSSIASFAFDCLEEMVGNKISKEVVYNEYCQYCHNNNLAIETIEMVGRKLTASAPYLRQGRNDENKTAWINVSFKHKKSDEVKVEDIDWSK